MAMSLIERFIFWLNVFPSNTGIFSTMSLGTIIKGCPRPDFNQNHIAVGAYVLVHTGTINNTRAIDISAIALKPLNKIGEHTFMSLLSGQKIRVVK